MSKVAVVYWSSTGNTEAMANAVVDGAKEKGADVTLYECADFRPELVADYDAIAFGCPAMGVKCWKKMNLNQCLTAAKLN